MPISRRRLLELGGALAALPAVTSGPSAHAMQAFEPTATPLLRSEGRYIPRWIQLLDDAGERQRIAYSLGPDQADMMANAIRDGRSQYAAFLSDETKALVDASLVPLDASANLVAVDAVQAIVEASRGHRVVMLNEAHIASRHRHLLSRLIPALHKEGFTHLAAETFIEGVESLGAGDPLQPKHGWYIHDPVFAEAVREALALGWRLVSYEQREDQQSIAPSMSNAATLVREQAQADNFRVVLDRNPNVRVLAFVGYGHLGETGQPFGARLKRDTGIDPLTVGQAGVGAFGPHAEDTPAIRALIARLKPTAPVVLLEPGQAPASAATEADLTAEATDLIVLHPVVDDIDGRPGWLAGDPARRRAEVRIPPGHGPRLLQAIHAGDPDPAIPADQYLVSDDGGPAVLWLRPGAYRLRIETALGFQGLGDQIIAAD